MSRQDAVFECESCGKLFSGHGSGNRTCRTCRLKEKACENCGHVMKRTTKLCHPCYLVVRLGGTLKKGVQGGAE